ncbi:MAG: hypothetical protein K2J44_07580 [Ruminococcus sp.]|nr:hypothetical protein [Ruminococcus sp.]
MVQSVIKAVNAVNADSALLEKIIDSQQMSSAEKLLEMFKKVETEVNKIYDKDTWIKIENKPFYYCKKGGFYVVDSSRHECANSGGYGFNIENVPTTNPTYNNHWHFMKSLPFYHHISNGNS